MKNLFFILFLSFGIALSSQNYYKFSYDIEDDNIYHDSYHSILLDDGNIVMLEFFLGTNYDDFVGYTLIKLNPQAEMLEKKIIYTESLYDTIECAHLGQTLISIGNSKLINNPMEDNSNIFVTIYKSVVDGLYHYHAMFFDDDLNLTDVVDTQILLENTTISTFNILLNDNNELVFCVRNSAENNYVFFLMDIYGDLKYVKHTDISTEEYEIASNSVFMYDEENSYYGCLLKKIRLEDSFIVETGKLTIFILDDEFNRINEKSFYEFKVPSYAFKIKLEPTINSPQTIKLSDGGFALISKCLHNGKSSLVILKMDKDLNIIGHSFLSAFNTMSLYTQFHPIIECKGGSLYALWQQGDDSNVIYSMISRFDKDLNLQWEIKYEDEEVYLFPIICSSNVMENGNLVACGVEFGTYHDYAPVCYIFQHDGTSVTENHKFRPYSFYPNPAKDNISIRFSPDVSCEKVEIYGLDGKLYHEQNFNVNSVDVSNLSSGVYMMKVLLDNGQSYIEKIVKE